MSTGYTLQKTESKVSSDGFLSWDDRAARKIFYSLQLNNKGGRYYSKVRKSPTGQI